VVFFLNCVEFNPAQSPLIRVVLGNRWPAKEENIPAPAVNLSCKPPKP
jgi:hypothetical protein